MATRMDNFRRKRELQEPAENTKMTVVGILLGSVISLTIIGKDNAKSLIWYWATFMTLLVIGCAVQDLIIRRKIKKEKL